MSRRGLFLFAAMSVIWGVPYLFIRIAVHEVPPSVLVFTRTLAAAGILLPIALARGQVRGQLPAMWKRWRALLAFAAVEIIVPWIALTSAKQRITSALAGLLVSAVPLVGVVIVTALGDRQHLGLVSLSGLALGLLGVVAIVGLDLHASDALALVEMGLVAIGYALGPVILSRYLAGLPSVAVMGTALGVAALVYAPLAIAQWPHTTVHGDAVLAIAVLAVLCTAIAFLLFSALIAEVGPVRATVITYVNPAVAALLGFAVLQEPLTWGMGVGFVLVLAGSTLATRRPPGAVEGSAERVLPEPAAPARPPEPAAGRSV